MTGIGFTCLATDGAARAGLLTTVSGEVATPAFMPVGTAATVKAMTPDAVAGTGAQIILANTYHLMLRPGAERIERLGGLHEFMDWRGPILTDSGGFQVMSLAKLRKIDEAGVVFRSHIDGSTHRLTPEAAVTIQRQLGADISMVLDECISLPASPDAVAQSTRLSIRWARRSKEAFEARPGRGIFAIVQGGTDTDLRVECAESLVEIGFDGYAVGGLAVGEARAAMFETLEATLPVLPAEAPRYLMGVGKPDDIVEAVRRGIDMFDCVLPTRSGRTAQAFTRRGEVNLRNARHADDPRPLDEACTCPTCARWSRAYLHHLVKADEILAPMALTRHNLHYYQDLMRDLRDAIKEGKLAVRADKILETRAAGDIAPV